MTKQKFQEELHLLQRFIKHYCHTKHSRSQQKNVYFTEGNVELHITLCEECSDLLFYSIKKLQECPHEIKPKCRRCPNPCYEKQEWKRLGNIMRYSGLKLGFLEVKQKFFKL